MKSVAAAAVLASLLSAAPSLAGSDAAPPSVQSALSDDSVKALALKWFADMQTGAIDRAQLTPEYSAQLTDDAVRGMAKYMQDHAYGAPPKRAEIIDERTTGNQKFYVVKLVFPRGDAASLLIGLDLDGKISGLGLTSMAGD